MTKTDGLLRSDDYDDDLSRNNLFTVHKKAIYLDIFNLAPSLSHFNLSLSPSLAVPHEVFL